MVLKTGYTLLWSVFLADLYGGRKNRGTPDILFDSSRAVRGIEVGSHKADVLKMSVTETGDYLVFDLNVFLRENPFSHVYGIDLARANNSCFKLYNVSEIGGQRSVRQVVYNSAIHNPVHGTGSRLRSPPVPREQVEFLCEYYLACHEEFMRVQDAISALKDIGSIPSNEIGRAHV